MTKELAVKTEIQEKLKDAVREKFQELLSDEEIDQFVDVVVEEFKAGMKTKVDEILKEELKAYVQQYLKEKSHLVYDGNRPKYDALVTQAITKAIPDIFENLLGDIIQSALSRASSDRY